MSVIKPMSSSVGSAAAANTVVHTTITTTATTTKPWSAPAGCSLGGIAVTIEQLSKFRVLSIQEPSATAILYHGKNVENRVWCPTLNSNKGEWIGIQVSKGVPRTLDDTLKDSKTCTTLQQLKQMSKENGGTLIGWMHVLNAVPYDHPDMLSQWATTDGFCWIIDKVFPLARPIPVSGKLKLFYLTEQERARLIAANP